MNSSRAILATLLAVLFFLTSLSAYGCLVPINGDKSSLLGIDCLRPSEEVPQPFCDTFKIAVVHKTSEVSPTTASDFLPTCGDPSLMWCLKVVSAYHRSTAFGSYAPSPDILLLISVLRI
jgi:hypothetical protein